MMRWPSIEEEVWFTFSTVTGIVKFTDADAISNTVRYDTVRFEPDQVN